MIFLGKKKTTNFERIAYLTTKFDASPPFKMKMEEKKGEVISFRLSRRTQSEFPTHSFPTPCISHSSASCRASLKIGIKISVNNELHTFIWVKERREAKLNRGGTEM